MDNKTKAIGGTSIAAALLFLFHIFHGMHSIGSLGDKHENSSFKNATVRIIQTDSNGLKDTSLMKDYLEKKDKAKVKEDSSSKK